MVLLAVLLCLSMTGTEWGVSEQVLLETHGDRASRPDSTTLLIVVNSGDTLVFRDRTTIEDAEEYAVHELRAYLRDQNLWVIVKGCYEWTENLLIDGSDGSLTEVVSVPIPSPDGTRLLCFNEDIMAGFNENGIQVWRVERDSLALEFQDLSVPWGPAEACWESDSLITFLKRTFDWELGEYDARPGRLGLSRDGAWVPDDPADWEL
jgi:hypothetical protein